MRGVIVGFGTIAEGHLHGYRANPGLEIVGVVDVTPERRALSRTVFGVPAYDSLDKALAATGGDFVDVCTPPTSHLAPIREAFAAGLPVLCEKPVFVPTDGGYEDVLDAIWAGGALLYPCQNYKFAPVFTFVRTILTSGLIGQPHLARIDIARSGHARGVPEWSPDWRRDPAVAAGGILRDHGPHAIYLLLSLLGVRPTAVSVLTGRLLDASPAGPGLDARARSFNNEDTALMRVRCSAGRVDGGPSLDADISLTWSAGHRSSRYLFVGTEGFVSVDNDVVTWARRGETERKRLLSDFDDSSHRAWFTEMLADFRRLVMTGIAGSGEAAELVTESLLTTSVIDAGYASALKGGQWLPIADPAPNVLPQVTFGDHE